VILTAGLGDWVATWRKLQAPIAKKTRACAWDRAGFGYSDPSPVPQGVNHTTADLEEALINADIPGPYILIGHSMGGYESMIFADRDHRAVLGMLLIDPSFPDEIRRANLVAPLFGAFLSKSIDERAVIERRQLELPIVLPHGNRLPSCLSQNVTALILIPIPSLPANKARSAA
jgi:pimeloyl-ACP methyl ester carboxylesterase